MLTENSVPEEQARAPIVAGELAEQEKNYYCQRCLNHNEYKPRKGHKPECRYLKCPCNECTMVEQRRQLNSLLSKKKVQCHPNAQTKNGKRVRDPHCARCSAHGVLVPLRGHKKTMCQFVTCACSLCVLVENRRNLMAAQIKLRRSQQKSRDGTEPKIRKSKKSKEENLKLNLNRMMMIVTTTTSAEDSQKRITGSSTSPSPSSTTDTMSPSLSMSPPPSPSTSILPPSPPILAAPIPVYPTPPNLQQLIQQPLLLNYIQNFVPPIDPPQPTVLPPFMMNEQLGALCFMYLKGCLKI